MQYTKIVKLASGNIQFQDASDNPVKTLQPAANLELLADDAGVRVKQWQGENTDILISQVAFTRIDPAADVAFSGTAQDLMTLLGDSFFFELEGGAFPDYPVGTYQSFGESYNTSTRILFANIIYGGIKYVKKRVTITDFSIRFTVASVGDLVIGLYKYTDNGTPVGLWDLVVQSNSATPFNTNVLGMQTIAIAPITLESGIYSFIVHTNNNTAWMTTETQLNSNTFFGWNSNLTLNPSYINSLSLASAYNPVLPASISSGVINAGLTPILITSKVV